MQQPYTWNGTVNLSTPPDWSSWIQRLYQSELQLQQMNDKLNQLQKQLDEVKNKPPVHIEYHFDQLKVNHLEGTLNVGLTPQELKGVESLEIPNPACMQVEHTQPMESEPPIRSLQDEMLAYMDDKSTDLLMGLEGKYGITLEEEHRLRVIEDVKKQINERVHYYARTSPYPSTGTDDELSQWRDTIKEKTRRDIQGAFSGYLNKLQEASLRRNKSS